MKVFLRTLIIAAISSVFPILAHAEDSDQPYIDSLKQSLPAKGSTGYSEQEKKKLSPESSEGYSEELQRELKKGPSGSYSEEEKKKLAPKEEGGAIEAVKEGHSELEAKKSGSVDSSLAIRVGLGLSRNFTANNGAGTGRAFSDVYGANYAPDLGLIYEHYFFEHEKLGTFGVFALGEVGFFNGPGRFAAQISNAYDGSPIAPNATNVTFRFFEIPGIVGAAYRLNLFKYVRPYAKFGPALIPYEETRSDGGATNQGLSKGYWGAAGIDILADWINESQDWERYADYSVKHTYFSFEYATMKTLSSPVDFDVSGAYAGIVFEF